MSYLLLRFEIYNETDEPKLLAVYSKDAIYAACSRFCKSFNMIVKNSRFGLNKWRGHPIESFMILFKGDAETLNKAFIFYLLENAQSCEEWNRFFIPAESASKCMLYPMKYIERMTLAAKKVKDYIRFCIPSEENFQKIFMLNIPTFKYKNKKTNFIYYDSNSKFIPKFLDRVGLYKYNSTLCNDNIDLYWSDESLIDELFENSNKEGRKALSRLLKANI